MREILEAIDKGNERARLAYDIYAHRLTREIGAMLAVLGGVDAIVFTGGIGENCAPLREEVCEQLGFLGLKLDAAKNARPDLDQNIAAAGSSVQVLVIRADEDWEIARECQRLAGARNVPAPFSTAASCVTPDRFFGSRSQKSAPPLWRAGASSAQMSPP